MRNERFPRAVALAAALAWSGAAAACTVAATPLSFGPIDPLAERQVDGAGAVEVVCPEPTAYTISITPPPSGGGYRQMVGDDNRLDYQLYSDAGYQLVWADGTGGTGNVGGAAGPVGTEHPIYGRAFPRAGTAPGQYRDTLVVTVSY